MAPLRIEPRPDGSLLLTDTGGGRWGMAVAGLGVGGMVLGSLATGGLTLIGSVVALPFGLIAVLAGLAAVRHRDWVLFDGPAGQIASRRGMTSVFRAVSTLRFDEVEAITVETGQAGVMRASGRRGAGVPPPGARGPEFRIGLALAGGGEWVVDGSGDTAYVSRLVAALHQVGGWPIRREPEQAGR